MVQIAIMGIGGLVTLLGIKEMVGAKKTDEEKKKGEGRVRVRMVSAAHAP